MYTNFTFSQHFVTEDIIPESTPTPFPAHGAALMHFPCLPQVLPKHLVPEKDKLYLKEQGYGTNTGITCFQ